MEIVMEILMIKKNLGINGWVDYVLKMLLNTIL
jgi:hypothetical protein